MLFYLKNSDGTTRPAYTELEYLEAAPEDRVVFNLENSKCLRTTIDANGIVLASDEIIGKGDVWMPWYWLPKTEELEGITYFYNEGSK